jgi:hypothetical protein
MSEPMKKRGPFLLIAGVLLAWAGYLALGAALRQPPTGIYGVLKPLIILSSMGLFLLFWWGIFTVSAKRRSEREEKSGDRLEEKP